MVPPSEQSKDFAVVLRLSSFDDLNGRIVDQSDAESAPFVQTFFQNRYGDGDGGGKLQIHRKQSKVRLVWNQPRYEPDAEEAHNSALACAKNKNFQEAINHWVRAISINPSDPDYYFNLGIAFFEKKNFQEAVENLRRAITLCPIYYKAHLILGTVYLKIRKFDRAEEYLRESLIFYPSHPLAYLNLGAVYSILKRYDEGISMFLKCIELSTNEVRAHFGLAKIYSLRGDSQSANRYFKNVIEINTNPTLTNHAKRAMVAVAGPDAEIHSNSAGQVNVHAGNVEKYYQLGYTSFLNSDYETAAEMYSAYLSLKANDDFVWYSLSQALLRSGKSQLACDALTKAIGINPSKGLYRKELALAYSYGGQDQNALGCLNEAEKLGKVDSAMYALWGKILLQQGDQVSALEKLEKALNLDSNNLLAKFNLALAAMASGDRDVALNHLHDILRTPIKSPLKMEAEGLLTRMSSS